LAGCFAARLIFFAIQICSCEKGHYPRNLGTATFTN